MGSKLMVELLRRGKTGNEILKILDAITSDEGKLDTSSRETVLSAVNHGTSEAVSF